MVSSLIKKWIAMNLAIVAGHFPFIRDGKKIRGSGYPAGINRMGLIRVVISRSGSGAGREENSADLVRFQVLLYPAPKTQTRSINMYNYFYNYYIY